MQWNSGGGFQSRASWGGSPRVVCVSSVGDMERGKSSTPLLSRDLPLEQSWDKPQTHAVDQVRVMDGQNFQPNMHSPTVIFLAIKDRLYRMMQDTHTGA